MVLPGSAVGLSACRPIGLSEDSGVGKMIAVLLVADLFFALDLAGS